MPCLPQSGGQTGASLHGAALLCASVGTLREMTGVYLRKQKPYPTETPGAQAPGRSSSAWTGRHQAIAPNASHYIQHESETFEGTNDVDVLQPQHDICFPNELLVGKLKQKHQYP